MAGLACSGSARAQSTYGSAPIGGRSALMGGTGTALGRDGAAPFLNPASIVNIGDSGVAFSVNFYSFQTTHLTDFHQPGPVDAGRYGSLSLPGTSLDTSRVDALPSTLCLFLTIGAWGDNAPVASKGGEPAPLSATPDAAPGHRKGRRKLAACIVTPERAQMSATAQGFSAGSGSLSATQALSIAQAWQRVYVGPSYGTYVSDSLAVGGSLLGAVAIASSTWSIDTILSDAGGRGSATTYDTGWSAYSVDVAATAGVLWHVDGHQVLGASLSTPLAHLFGHYQGTTSVQSLDGAGSSALTTSSGNYTALPPLRVAAGVGSDLGRLRIEADATGYVPLTDLADAGVSTTRTTLAGGASSSTSFGQSMAVSGQPLVDAAFGFEWFLNPSLSLLGGASTDFSAMKPLAPSPPVGTLAESRMQRVTGSIGIGSYGEGSELLLGAQLSYGWGKSIALDPYVSPPELALVDQRTFGAMLVVAGGVSLSAFRRTLQDLRTVVRLPQVRP